MATSNANTRRVPLAWLPVALLTVAGVFFAPIFNSVASNVSDDAIAEIMERHCVSCHAASPTHPSVIEPPSGLILESVNDVRANADAIMLQTVDSDLMPLGNETGMTDDERAMLGAWLAQQ